jgi:hypothetical protein
MGGWWCSASRPGRFYPRERDPVTTVQEAGWAPGPVWTGAENLDPMGFDPRTIQTIVNHYTNYAILAHNNVILYREITGTHLAACHMLRTTVD